LFAILLTVTNIVQKSNNRFEIAFILPKCHMHCVVLVENDMLKLW